MDTERLRLFDKVRHARFLHRPNRFIVECLIDGRKRRAYLPNPGKLRELLLPGAKLYLTENAAPAATRFTCVAVEREGAPVMLHTHRSNTVARWLLARGAVPGFEGCRVVRPEVTRGGSRFDFLLEKAGRELLLEVKSCTLFGSEIAMFPDAETLRGRRHLLELAELSRQGTPGGVLFIVHSPRVRYFMPEHHTDLAFARALCEVRHDLTVTALGIGWTEDLVPFSSPRQLEIPWDLIEGESHDCGDYLVVLRLRGAQRIEIGGLGAIPFRKGYYIYVGSARKGLTRRIERHRRLRKRPFWHIDYLRERADFIAALPVRSSDRLECALAAAVAGSAEWSVPGFGSSDCGCPSHLFGRESDPLSSPDFSALLQQFRIDRLGAALRFGTEK